MFTSAKELIELAHTRQCAISEIIRFRETELYEKPAEAIYEGLRQTLAVMKAAAEAGRSKEIKTRGDLISGDAKKLNDYLLKGRSLCGKTLNVAMARALSCAEVNASMGRICAAPTAGSCGIIPAALITVAEEFHLDEQSVLNGLLTSAGIGMLIDAGASLSGARSGCQAECGAASAMAAGAVVEMLGGSPEASFHAAAIALKNIMGLVCDPVAGLVESPCAKRNASGVLNALLSADLALAGIQSVIPFDEVVDAMNKVGKLMPYQLRETALGGIAATPTAKEISKRIHGKE
jgi:L-serine dehydratase